MSVSPASAKGSCSASVVQGALGGSASGGGLAYASSLSRAKNAAQSSSGTDWNLIGRTNAAITSTLVVGLALSATVLSICAVTVGIGCLIVEAAAGALAGGSVEWIASRQFGESTNQAAKDAAFGGVLGMIGGPAISKEFIP